MFVGDDAVRVSLAHYAENGIAVKVPGARAGTGLQMVADSAGSGEVDFAEGAGDVGAAVDLRVEVLRADL